VGGGEGTGANTDIRLVKRREMQDIAKGTAAPLASFSANSPLVEPGVNKGVRHGVDGEPSRDTNPLRTPPQDGLASLR